MDGTISDQVVPETMRAIALSKYSKPRDYSIATLPTPQITKPDQLLIRVHAASVNPIDVKLASGLGRFMEPPKFPYQIGYDLAGTVIQAGSSAATRFPPGSRVYTRVPNHLRGTIAQYALSTTSRTALKPPSLPFAAAAAVPLAGQTAWDALAYADRQLEGGLRGKTVLVPAGLSGTGSFAVQIAKRVYGAGRVVTTVSTGKVARVEEVFGAGAVDQVVDYTRGSGPVLDEVGRGSVDFMFDTAAQSLALRKAVKKGGLVVSISAVPSGDAMRPEMPQMKTFVRVLLNVADWLIRTWMSLWGVRYHYHALRGSTETLEKLSTAVEEGKIRPVVGEKVLFSDIEGIRRGCQRIFDGKGGLGKFVIEMDE